MERNINNNPRFGEKKGDDVARVNFQIKAREVRVIDPEGEMLGVMQVRDAINRAKEFGLDLVEVSPNANPPVCKIQDFGKFKYELQKKKNEAKKKQKTITLKEIQLSPTIDKHDLEIKLRHAKEFLEEGNKVKFSLRFRGRQMAHIDLGAQQMERAKQFLQEIAKVEYAPKMEGKQMIMIVVPNK
jgi:translation initiation factor IF-3